MKAGDVITEDCVRSVRPGYGLAPKELSAIIGRKMKRNIKFNSAVSYDLIEI